MTSILGFSELLLMRREQLGAELTRFAELIHGSGSRLLALINDILDLSRIESGGMRIVNRPCDPVQIVSDVVESLQLQAQQKGLTLSLQSEPGIPQQIQSDAARLKQILTNLIENAIKFTSQEGARHRSRRANRCSSRSLTPASGSRPSNTSGCSSPSPKAMTQSPAAMAGRVGLSISRGLGAIARWKCDWLQCGENRQLLHADSWGI